MRPPRRRRRALGQNFLRNMGAADRIVELFAPRSGETVLEIGPGEGVLTGRLLDRGATVVAVETDARLVARLRESFPGRPGLHLHEADALKADFGALVGPHLPAGGRARVLSNLPYSVGTGILVRLLERTDLFSSMMLMLQKEVADRVCAPCGSRTYGSLSVLVQYHAEPRRVMTLAPGSFHPAPKVRSAVVSLEARDRRELDPADEPRYAAFLQAAFRSRRRTLPNNLAPAWRCEAAEAVRRIEAAGVDPGLRPEALDRAAFIRLFLAGPPGL